MTNKYYDLAVSEFNRQEKRNFGLIPASVGFDYGLDIYKGKELNWWRKEGFFQFPVGLKTSFDYLSKKDSDSTLIREQYCLGDDFFLMLDSGGFQIYSMEVGIRKQSGSSYSLPTLVDFMIKQKADVGFTLDLPITIDDRKNFQLINDKIEKVYRNNIIFTEIVDKYRQENFEWADKFRGYNILQGFGYKEMLAWYDGVNMKGFEGWGIGLRHKDSFSIASSLAFLYEKGIQTNCHVLGVGSYRAIALLVYIGRKYISNLTFDSTVYGMGRRFKNYTLFNANGITDYQYGRDFDGIKGGFLPCHCPVCSLVRNVDEMAREGTVSGQLMILHNLYQYISAFGYFLCLLDEKGDDIFRKEITKLFGTSVEIGIDFFEECIRYGYEQTSIKYNSYFRELERGEVVAIVNEESTVHYMPINISKKDDNLLGGFFGHKQELSLKITPSIMKEKIIFSNKINKIIPAVDNIVNCKVEDAYINNSGSKDVIENTLRSIEVAMPSKKIMKRINLPTKLPANVKFEKIVGLGGHNSFTTGSCVGEYEKNICIEKCPYFMDCSNIKKDI